MYRLVAILVLLALVAAACGSAASPSTSPTASPTPSVEPQSEGLSPTAAPPGAGLIAVARVTVTSSTVGALSIDGLEQWSLDLEGTVQHLAWAPNGNALGIHSASERELLLVTPGGEVTTRLRCDAFSWSPDGTRLAILRDGGLFRYDLATEAEEPIGPGWWISDVVWLPGGESLLFQSDERVRDPMNPPVGEPVRGLYRLSLADGAVTQLLDARYYLRPSPSPDGSRVAVIVTDGMTYNGDAYLLDLASREMTPIGYAGWDASPWSPDGERLLLDDNQRAWVADLEGAVSAVVATSAKGQFTSALGWSPDGEWLLLTTQPLSGTTGSVRAVSADGERVVDLGDGELATWQPVAR